MQALDFIYRRKSIRKFKPDPIPNHQIEAILKAAIYAPSGSNAQNYHFVVVKSQKLIQAMTQAIIAQNEIYCTYTEDEGLRTKFKGSLYYQTLFKDAPVVILAYASPYSPGALQLLKEKPGTSEEIRRLLWHSPGIQNLGAAFENLLLAAAALGLGTCWMTAPLFAEDAISDAISFHSEGFRLVCMTPLGIPSEDNNPQPLRRPLEETVTFLE